MPGHKFKAFVAIAPDALMDTLYVSRLCTASASDNDVAAMVFLDAEGG